MVQCCSSSPPPLSFSILFYFFFLFLHSSRLSSLSNSDFADHSQVHRVLKETCEESHLPLQEAFTACRLVLTGGRIGAGVPHTLSVLGKETSLRRMQATLSELPR